MFELDDKRLALFDDLERHPIIYERTDIAVTLVEDRDGTPIPDSERKEEWCQAYLLKDYRPELLQRCPMLQDYDRDAVDEHAYVPPSARDKNVTGDWWEDVKLHVDLPKPNP